MSGGVPVAASNTATAGFSVTVRAPSSTTGETLCSVLGKPVLPDIDLSSFQGEKGKKVTVIEVFGACNLET